MIGMGYISYKIKYFCNQLKKYMNKLTLFLAAILSFSTVYSQQDSVLFAGEHHFKNIIQLTNGGDNAEAYLEL
jgi:hypothetical protein